MTQPTTSADLDSVDVDPGVDDHPPALFPCMSSLLHIGPSLLSCIGSYINTWYSFIRLNLNLACTACGEPLWLIFFNDPSPTEPA